MDTLNAFWCSNADCIQERHVKSTRRTTSRGEEVVVDRQWVLRTARAAWEWMKSGGRGTKGILPMAYAGVFKLFQLQQKTEPVLGKFFDVIMLDEGQDINDCMASIVVGQTNAGVIIVGDPHQVGAWGNVVLY